MTPFEKLLHSYIIEKIPSVTLLYIMFLLLEKLFLFFFTRAQKLFQLHVPNTNKLARGKLAIVTCRLMICICYLHYQIIKIKLLRYDYRPSFSPASGYPLVLQLLLFGTLRCLVVTHSSFDWRGRNREILNISWRWIFTVSIFRLYRLRKVDTVGRT